MIAAMPDGLLGVRDRALLLVGFMGAFRRSELVGLDWGDCTFTREGVVLKLRRSKTDQEGLGRKVAIPAGANAETCAVRALQAWREASGTDAGPIFRPVDRHRHVHGSRLSAYAVALVVKRYAAAAGGWIPPTSPATAFAPGSLLLPPSPVRRKGRSWPRRGTKALAWSAGTSATAISFERMPPAHCDCECHPCSGSVNARIEAPSLCAGLAPCAHDSPTSPLHFRPLPCRRR